MDLEIIILSEVGERLTSHNTAYMQNLKKNDTNEFIYKTETLTDLENRLGEHIYDYQGERSEERKIRSLGLM